MRKHQQAQILELLRMLNGAHDALRKGPGRETASKLLTNCRVLALQIGQFITEIEGEGTQTCASLKEYCDFLNQAGSGVADAYFFKKLQVKLAKTETLARGELKPNKIEVVFFPYKYSMADSLESIWLAAMADPQCDAYICPIPYFERLQNGAPGKMRYEGDCYPKELPLVDWQEYNVETRRPDIIFIHNPYDDGNYVTSVHPSFYSKRLRNFTDMLVYAPYFVTMDEISEDFCIAAGNVFAHKVVLQSEKVRDIYINTFKKHYGDKFGKPEDKFIALGSPKFDKCVNARREDFSLPDEWKSLIGNKKVFFFNSTLGAILKSNEQYLKKLRYILDTFRKRDDVVLWWRPHPLSGATLHSMRPQLLYEYNSIVSGYVREKWGVYDDTPDPHRAIALSDAYYGDWSSLVSMYQLTGKPIMIANPDFLNEAQLQFSPTCVHVSDDGIWFSVRCINALFRMNKTDWSLQLVGGFPGENGYTLKFYNSLYQCPAEINGVLYFPPFLASEIAAYSPGDNTFEKISYKRNDDNIEITKAFIGAAAYDNFIFFTPFLYPAIIKLNTETKEIVYYTDWVDKINNIASDMDQPFFLLPLILGKTLWLASCRANAVLEFNIETCEFTVHEVGQSGYLYNGICFDGANLWLTPRLRTNTPLIKWNPQTGIIKEFFEIYSDEADKNEKGFIPGVYCGGYIWLLPNISINAVKVDVHNDIVSIADEFNLKSLKDENNQPIRYVCVRTFENSIYAYSQQKGTFIEYNCANKERREEVIRYSPETAAQLEPLFAHTRFLNDINAMNSVYDCYYYESDYHRLNYFICYITKENKTEEEMQSGMAMAQRRIEIARSTNVNADGTAGRAIYSVCKSGLPLFFPSAPQ